MLRHFIDTIFKEITRIKVLGRLMIFLTLVITFIYIVIIFKSLIYFIF